MMDLLLSLLLALPPQAPQEPLPIHLELLWPKGVARPKGLTLMHRPAKYSQRLVISDGRDSNLLYHVTKDDRTLNSFAQNPNHVFPYALSGGLQNSTGWVSIKAQSIPGPVHVWTERVPVARASRPLPKVRWAFPEGTTFVDALVKDGELFELRTSKLSEEGWKQEVAYRNLEKAPKNFHGAGQACISCHKDAGASLQYGITVRGDDRVFSWYPFVDDGTFTLRPDVQFLKTKPKRLESNKTSSLSGSRLFSLASILSRSIQFALPPQAPRGWRTNYADAVAESKRTGKPLLIDLRMTPCVWCDKMERAFDEVELAGLVLLRLDGPSNPALTRALSAKAYPTLVLAQPDGTITKVHAGYLDPAALSRWILPTQAPSLPPTIRQAEIAPGAPLLGPGWHRHKCPACGHVWSHGPPNNKSHVCPACGKASSYVHYRGPVPSRVSAAAPISPVGGACVSSSGGG